LKNEKPVDETKESRNKLFKMIVNEFLDGNTFAGAYLNKRIKDFGVDYDVMYIVLEQNMDYLKGKVLAIPYHKGRINYIFAALKDQIYK
jgi:hypothetical protein